MIDRLGALVAFALLVVVCVLGWENLHGDNTDAIDEATRVACGSALCTPELLDQDRRIGSQTLRFSIGRDQKRTVVCSREFWLTGAYSCFVTERN